MPRYAENTTVASDRSRAEIERTLQRYKATAFAYGWEDDVATVMFKIADRRMLFRLRMPDRNSEEFTLSRHKDRWRRQPVSAEQAQERWEQAGRQRWRALALVIKAKLEAVEAGITTVESEFLAHILLPDGSTVGEWAAPQLELAYSHNEMPALMPGASR